ncbi:MAG: HEAT repeat domain-containing protein [Deltaproteobacteria bacterium]|nr:HEAT repeat domain-containing protein [Deltaproteobacteria bacterium]
MVKLIDHLGRRGAGPLGLALVGLLVSAALGGSARAERSRDDQRASLVSLLGAYELLLERPALDTIGSRVPELLIDIASHPSELPRVRVRALAGLALYPSETTFGYLRAQLLERSWLGNGLGTQMRRQALRSLARGFGDRAFDDVISLRQDTEPLVREAVAQSLADMGSTRAVPVLEAWLPHEQVFAVRDAVDKALGRLRRL